LRVVEQTVIALSVEFQFNGAMGIGIRVRRAEAGRAVNP
jgi:hypothetical protein